MPELPDVAAYQHALRRMVVGQKFVGISIVSPFLLRTFEPPCEAAVARRLREVQRLGKRLALEFDGDLYFVIHLMIAGRLRWARPDAKPPGRIGLAVMRFEQGALLLTEASPKKRAALHVVTGRAALEAHRPPGLEVLTCSFEEFASRLRLENYTLKRALTDPRLLSGIGNAYSDEILHAARLSPVTLTGKLTDDELRRLFDSSRAVLQAWTERLRRRFDRKFPGPGEITAFRPEFAVHGRFEHPCPVCGSPVQRIRYSERETNYCPRCQTGGRILADRSLSRLMGRDWPPAIGE